MLAHLAMNQGAVPPILSALGASPTTLRAAALDRYRQPADTAQEPTDPDAKGLPATGTPHAGQPRSGRMTATSSGRACPRRSAVHWYLN
jgi:hypothetical protein